MCLSVCWSVYSMHINVCWCVSVYMYLCLSVNMYMCVHVQVCACVCVCVLYAGAFCFESMCMSESLCWHCYILIKNSNFSRYLPTSKWYH